MYLIHQYCIFCTHEYVTSLKVCLHLFDCKGITETFTERFSRELILSCGVSPKTEG